jgi:hypothetical protein|tara:strand:- start:54 stop:1055 length:1002 start_codon:yes stop_codon:yes gene_type:complete
MPKLVNSNKFHEVSGFLANLEINKEYLVQDIIDACLQIVNLKEETKQCLIMLKGDYSPTNGSTKQLKDLWVTMSYQRVIRLKKILKKIVKQGGFDKEAAGAIDIAIRPNGKKYVWDGFRRCIKAGLCGSDRIESTIFIHDQRMENNECEKKEARLFKIRNADSEAMLPEELFKSRLAFDEPEARQLLKLMKNCELDVLGLNPNGIQLGGFRWFENSWISKTIDDYEFEFASEIIRKTFKAEENVSAYLLVSLAYILTLNDNMDEPYSESDIKDKFKKWYDVQDKNKQTDITKDGHRNKKLISWIIAKRVLKDNNGLRQACEVTEEQLEVIGEL